MTTKKEIAPIKISLRVEDQWWVAYVGSNDPRVTEAPMEVARINIRYMDAAPDGQERFKRLVVDGLTGMLTEMGNSPVRIDERIIPR